MLHVRLSLILQLMEVANCVIVNVLYVQDQQQIAVHVKVHTLYKIQILVLVNVLLVSIILIINVQHVLVLVLHAILLE